jgi:MobA/MobL family
MSIVHFDMQHHTMSRASNGAGAARYLQRLGEFAPSATRVVTYLDRRGEHVVDRQDLVATGTRNLPAWAEGRAEVFFSAATTYERANGRWATAWQATLPRELSPAGQQALVNTFLDTHLQRRPLLWAIHNPQASDGSQQPHVHLLFSERLADGIERPTWQTFRRYNAAHPEQGGARKSIFGHGDVAAPYRLRVSWCTLANVALEREGVTTASLDPRSLDARGLTRAPTRVRTFTTPEGMREHVAIDERTPATRAVEQALAQQWWTERKRALGLTNVHTLDQAALSAQLDAEVRTTPTQAREPARERAEARDAAQAILAALDPWAQERLTRQPPAPPPAPEGPVVANKRSGIYHVQTTDPNFYDIHPKNMVVFQTGAAAEAAGYRAAVNQHYARQTHTRVADVARLERQRDGLLHEATRMRGQRLAVEGRILGTGQALLAGRRAAFPLGGGRTFEGVSTSEDVGGGLHGPGLQWGHETDRGHD